MSAALPMAMPMRMPARLLDLLMVWMTSRLSYFLMSGTQLSPPKST